MTVLTDQELVQLFSRLEQEFADAVRAKDAKKLEGMLDKAFTLTVSGRAAHPMTREQLFETLPRYNVRSFDIRNLSCREFGDIVVVGMVMDLKADVSGQDRSNEFFVTDVWQKVHHHWCAVARYSALVEKEVTPGFLPPS